MWTYHSKLTNDARELFLYTVTAAPAARPGSPGQYVVVKRVDDKEAQVHAQLCAARGAAIPGSRFSKNNNTTCTSYPHIIQVFDCIPLRAVPGLPTTTDAYLVLEHATGGTLEALLARLQSRQPTAAARFPFNKPNRQQQQQQQLLPGWFCYHVLAAVLDAVLRMHTRDGVLHTDLHLKNVVFQKQQMVSLPPVSSAPLSLFPNPDEIPLEEPAAAGDDGTTNNNAADLRWAAPVVKIIDFGRVHQLPEPEDDDDDGRGQWEAQPSPCVGLLARLMLQQARDLYDDGGGFAASFLEPLAKSQVSVAVLREARYVAMARKEENVYVPRWLREYFQ